MDKEFENNKPEEKCPNCGAPVDINSSANCPYCDSTLVKDASDYAMSKKTGAREISNIVDNMFSDIMFDISDPDEKYKELEISKETVTDPKKYILRK